MAVTPPTRGQQDWDDEMNNALQSLDAAAQSAAANASTAVSTANSARDIAQSVHTAVIGTADAATAGFINDPASETTTALSATIAAATAATQTAMRKIAEGVEDVNILCLDDSTSAGTSLWFGRLPAWLGTQWPDHTVTFREWNPTTQAWSSTTTIQTGTNGRTIAFHNGAIGGQNHSYPQRDRLKPMVGDIQPDLIFTGYLYNDDRNTLANAQWFVVQLAATLESVLLVSPRSSIVILGKPGKTADEQVAYRSSRLAEYARSKGFGWIDMRRAFEAADPNWRTTLVQPDGIHPTTGINTVPPSGQDVMLDAVKKHMVYVPGAQFHTQQPSSFAKPSPNLLVNGDFSDWTGSSPAGWTPVNTTASKDTTWKETGRHGLKGVATAADGAWHRQDISAIPYRGKWLTVTARVRIPVGTTTPSGNGLVQLLDGTTSPISSALRSPGVAEADGFGWASTTIRVSPTATTIQVILMHTLTGGAADQATFDRVTLTEGVLPADSLPVVTAAVDAQPERLAPAGFAMTHLVPRIYRTGFRQFATDLDVQALRPPAGVTYYVAPNGTTGAAGTSADVPTNIATAVGKPDVGTIIYAPGEYFRDKHAGSPTAKSINHIASGPGVKVTGWETPSNLTWTLEAGSIYKTTRSATQLVADTRAANRTAWGDYAVYVKKDDLASITGPGQWAIVNSTVYVWALGDANLATDASFMRLSVTSVTGVQVNGNNISYVEGIEFEGGGTAANGQIAAFTANSTDATAPRIVAVDCSVKYNLASGYSLTGGLWGVFVRCLSQSNGLDGFNYHKDTLNGSPSVPEFIEIDCTSRHNGVNATVENCNASSAHDGVVGIRLNGEYANSFGPLIADVTGAKTWNLGCLAKESDAVTNSYAFAATGPTTAAQMWLDECLGTDCDFGYVANTGSILSIAGTVVERCTTTVSVSDTAKAVRYTP